jgi:hypothetical protein
MSWNLTIHGHKDGLKRQDVEAAARKAVALLKDADVGTDSAALGGATDEDDGKGYVSFNADVLADAE